MTLYYQRGWTLIDISRRLRTSLYQVRKVLGITGVCEAIPTPKQKRKRFDKLHDRAKEYLMEKILKRDQILTSVALQDLLKRDIGLRVSTSLIRGFLSQRLSMSYRKINHLSANHNIMRNKIMRQAAAGQLIDFLSKGFTILNIDEAIIQATDNRNYSWVVNGNPRLITGKQRMGKVSLIAACSSAGGLLFTANLGTTSTNTFLLFLIKLSHYMNSSKPNWRSSTVLLIDNAPYHRSARALRAYQDLKLPVMFLGPYQFHMAPIEQVYRYIKQRNLNPQLSKAQTRQDNVHLTQPQRPSSNIHKRIGTSNLEIKVRLDIISISSDFNTSLEGSLTIRFMR